MYPKPRGLQCKMSQAVRLWVFLVAAVATLGLVAAKSVDQQQQHELLSCEHVSNFFSSINVTIKPTNKNQGKFGPLSIYAIRPGPERDERARNCVNSLNFCSTMWCCSPECVHEYEQCCLFGEGARNDLWCFHGEWFIGPVDGREETRAIHKSREHRGEWYFELSRL